MIGQGEIPKKKFFNKKTGKVEKEKGTGEIEATIPIGTEIKKTGKKSYTIINGKKYAVDDWVTIQKRMDADLNNQVKDFDPARPFAKKGEKKTSSYSDVKP